MKNIYAHTEQGSDYPAYLSINRDELGLRISVRGPGNGGRNLGEIRLSPEQLESMATAVLAEIGGEAPINTEAAVKNMVDRFLGWKLPKDFGPDAGISFKPTNPDGYDTHWWPAGTNLLTADQAKEMFRHCLDAK